MNAFVSCSLRKEDEHFVDYVCRVLEVHGIQTYGTVGKFTTAPENPVESMKKNIPSADIVVICATPRYLQKDISTGKETKGLSEMIHVEAGMALAHNKPVVVFVQEGTDVGAALPNVTQYIVLNGSQEDFLLKRSLIYSLLSGAYHFVQSIRADNSKKKVTDIVITGLAIYGTVKLLQAIFGKDGN